MISVSFSNNDNTISIINWSVSYYLDPDGTPNDFTLTTTSSSSFTVTWRPVDKLLQNGEIVNYTIDCNDTMVPEMEVSPISSLENSMGEYTYSIEGFSPGTQYQCAIHANTSVGAGPPAFDTGRTLEERKITFNQLYMYMQ